MPRFALIEISPDIDWDAAQRSTANVESGLAVQGAHAAHERFHQIIESLAALQIAVQHQAQDPFADVVINEVAGGQSTVNLPLKEEARPGVSGAAVDECLLAFGDEFFADHLG